MAALCVWFLTPRPLSDTNLNEVGGPDLADDAGGAGLPPPLASADPIAPPPPSTSRLGRYTHAAVAVDSVPCAGVGRAVLERAGTAVDAAVAALLCNGVTTSQSAGLGGGFIMTVVLANGTRAALVARETAPAAATRTMFANRSSTLGPLAAGVPGELLGLWEAKQRFGNPAVPWTDLLQPAIKLCEEGITVSADAARALARKADSILADPGLAAVFGNFQQ